jgi:hypothetical protein
VGLANSVFQGSVIVSEKHFLESFPSASGYGVFLAQAGRSRADTGDTDADLIRAERALSAALGNRGIELERTVERLAAFYAVQNTYLAIFLFLGALGVLLGTAGLAVLVARNLDESRGELAVLRAIGFSKPRAAASAVVEHLIPTLSGLAIGAASAGISSVPILASSGPVPSAGLVVALVFGGLAAGTFWIVVTAAIAVRADFLVALRQE